MASALRLDPTRSAMLRHKFMRDVRKRFNGLAAEVWKYVVTDDELALGPEPKGFSITTNARRHRFLSSDAKLAEFNRFINEVSNRRILEKDQTPWTGKYVREAHRKGLTRSYASINIRKIPQAQSPIFRGAKAQFIKDVLQRPEILARVRLLSSRSFEDVKGVTNDMAAKLSRIMAEGIARGDSNDKIGKAIAKEIKISKNRAMRIARTEITRAHAEGQLDGLESMGIEKVKVAVEWRTAGDDRVCEKCQPLEGIVLTIKEARGLLPRHPECRCAFEPVYEDSPTKGQTRSRTRIARAIARSVKAENPKSPTPKKDSTWLGASLKLRFRRPLPVRGQTKAKAARKPAAKKTSKVSGFLSKFRRIEGKKR